MCQGFANKLAPENELGFANKLVPENKLAGGERYAMQYGIFTDFFIFLFRICLGLLLCFSASGFLP